MAKWNITSQWNDGDAETILDIDTPTTELEIEAETEEQALTVAYEKCYIARYKAVPAVTGT